MTIYRLQRAVSIFACDLFSVTKYIIDHDFIVSQNFNRRQPYGKTGFAVSGCGEADYRDMSTKKLKTQHWKSAYARI